MNGVCTKKRYPSRTIAKQELKRINKTSKTVHLTNTYYCDRCGCWHNTSMAKEQSRNFSRYLLKKKKGF